jgi:16S rRNA processing protein RimM
MAPRRESASSSTSSTDLLRVGRVGRPHGTGGAFTVAEATERTELIDAGRSVVVGGRELQVVARRGTAAHPILTVAGVDDRTAAEALRGEPITVPRTALGALGEGEYLVDDLLGCTVVDGERVIGRVRDVLVLPAAEVLEVETEAGDELLVPMVRDAVRGVDLARRTIGVDMRFFEGA